MAKEEIRIHVYLAHLGYGSRREIEGFIKEGKISVNGKPAFLGQKIDPAEDQIKFKRKLIATKKQKPKTVVYMFNKPQGVVTTVKDPQGRTTVMEFIPKKHRVYPVGRLDLNSEGLLLLTNDGELAHQLTHPTFEIPKVYEVKIRGAFSDKKISHLERGVQIGNKKYQPAQILEVRDVTREGVKKYVVKIKVFEGKNHHVKKLFEALSCRVVRLKRVSMGPLRLRGLPLGEYRLLEDSRIKSLKNYLQTEAKKALKKKRAA